MWQIRITLSFGKLKPEDRASLKAGESIASKWDKGGFNIEVQGIPNEDYMCGHWVNDLKGNCCTIYRIRGAHILSMFDKGQFDYKVPLYKDGDTFKYDHPRGGTKTLYCGQYHNQIMISGIGGFERDDTFSEYRK